MDAVRSDGVRLVRDLILLLCLLRPAQAGQYCRGSTCFDNLDDLSEFSAKRDVYSDNVDRVCYADVGCFSKTEGPLAFLHALPDNPAWINPTFTLYSDKTPNGTDIHYKDPATFMNLRFLNRSPKWLTFVVHGFGSGPGADWLQGLKDAVLDDIGGYVIVVGWSKGAELPHYHRAAANTDLIGRMLARLAQRLIISYPSGLSASRMHFIGHSLGAQMAHFFSLYLHEISGLKPARITALDAAGPEFEASGVFVNRNDADFVEGLHTSAGRSLISGELGMIEPFGHVDFYANGGQRQPGCSSFNYGCSHTRAHELYIESRKRSGCRFISYPCAGGVAQYVRKKCIQERSQWSEFGWNTPQTPGRGVQFFETNDRSPFCESPKQIPSLTLSNTNF
ncbi:phospholipase A1 [Galendromus occidentalis]|uniref:Phospholipase A1 n=1 Tax=Galendromus occidentalis TaxID=34638 RepID=A0AAJ7PA31_9ACAR|nr:phospholipase A1 [Galendromus occidentalis]